MEGSADSDQPNTEEEISYRMVLSNKDFTKILIAQIGSNFGDALLRIALLLYIYDVTGSLTLTTLILSAQLAPWIIVGPISGVFADRISRKLILVSADITRMMAIIIFPFTTNTTVMVVLAFIVGTASASFAAPRSAAIPEITGLKLYVKAISLSQMIFQTMAILGPIAGALIYARFETLTFFITSGSFSISAIFILLTTIPSAQSRNEKLTMKSVFRDLGEGIKYLLTEDIIRKIIVLFTIIIIGGVLVGTLIYPYIYNILYLSNEDLQSQAQREFGYIGAISALGSALGYIIFGKYEKKIGRPKGVFWGSFLTGVYCVIFIFEPSVLQLLIISLFLGIASGMMSLAVNAIFAETVPNEIRGRAYSATNAYLQVFSMISISGSGWLADKIGIVDTMTYAGIGIMILVVIFTLATGFFKFLVPKSLPQEAVAS